MFTGKWKLTGFEVKNANCHNHEMLLSLSCNHVRQSAVIIVMWPLETGADVRHCMIKTYSHDSGFSFGMRLLK